MQEYENYKPTPFYFINDTIERTEIVRQLDIMQETGVSSFFLHIRDGILDQAYGINPAQAVATAATAPTQKTATKRATTRRATTRKR